MTRLTLITRSGCSLCEAMELELARLAGRYNLLIEPVDVDSDPALVERYNDLVPLLLDGEQELCRYFLDEEQLRSRLGI